MRVLTLTQPWASLVAIGAKRIETRSWPTPYRGTLAIHAAKGYPQDAYNAAITEPIRSALRAGIINCYSRPNNQESVALPEGRLEPMPFGAVVAVCEIVGCYPTELIRENGERSGWFSDQERAFGNYSPHRYGFLLDSVRALPEPIPAKGSLGLWVPSTDLLAKITAALEGSRE